MGTVTNAYHNLTGRLDSVATGGAQASYGYLAQSSRIESTTFGSGSLVSTRAYDNLERLSSISNAATGETLPLSYAYTYNLASQRTRTDEGNGKYWDYQYDPLGQLTQGNHCLADGTVLGGQDFDYAFDEIGNRTSSGGRVSSQSTYDSNYRNEYEDRTVADKVDIIGVDEPSSTVTVEGQTATRSGEYFHSEVSVSNSANPVYPTIDITTTSNGGQNVSGEIYVPEDEEVFDYDDDGNLTKDGRWHYTWDAENRLVQMHSIAGVPSNAAGRLEFEYDYQGRRIAKKVYDQASQGTLLAVIHYLYDGWNLMAETDSAGTIIRRYLWGTDLSGTYQGAGGVGGLIAVIDETENPIETHYVSYDGNGNIVSLNDPSSGKWSARYEYGPFGELIRTTGDPIAFANPFRFSTKYTDAESGFLNYGRRLYNPTTGRWLSKDPIEEDGGVNLYGFVLNNPINGYDMLGLDPRTQFDFRTGRMSRIQSEVSPRLTLGQLHADLDPSGHEGALVDYETRFQNDALPLVKDLGKEVVLGIGPFRYFDRGLDAARNSFRFAGRLGRGAWLWTQLRTFWVAIPKNVKQRIPANWTRKNNKSGVGFRWVDPKNEGNGIRIDKGNPNVSLPSQQVDHVVIRYGGKIRGPDGNPIKGPLSENPQAHIPLEEYRKWDNWYQP